MAGGGALFGDASSVELLLLEVALESATGELLLGIAFWVEASLMLVLLWAGAVAAVELVSEDAEFSEEDPVSSPEEPSPYGSKSQLLTREGLPGGCGVVVADEPGGGALEGAALSVAAVLPSSGGEFKESVDIDRLTIEMRAKIVANTLPTLGMSKAK